MDAQDHPTTPPPPPVTTANDSVLRTPDLMFLIFQFQPGLWRDLHPFNATRSCYPDEADLILTPWLAEYSLDRLSRLLESIDEWKPQVLEYAARHGRLDVLAYMTTDFPESYSRSGWAMQEAASHGQVCAMEYLHRVGYCERLVQAAEDAAEHGHLQVLQHLDQTYAFRDWFRDRTLIQAVRNGRLDMLQWFFHVWQPLPNQQRQDQIHEWALASAVRHRHWDMATWLAAGGTINKDVITRVWCGRKKPACLLPFLDPNDVVRFVVRMAPSVYLLERLQTVFRLIPSLAEKGPTQQHVATYCFQLATTNPHVCRWLAPMMVRADVANILWGQFKCRAKAKLKYTTKSQVVDWRLMYHGHDGTPQKERLGGASGDEEDADHSDGWGQPLIPRSLDEVFTPSVALDDADMVQHVLFQGIGSVPLALCLLRGHLPKPFQLYQQGSQDQIDYERALVRWIEWLVENRAGGRVTVMGQLLQRMAKVSPTPKIFPRLYSTWASQVLDKSAVHALLLQEGHAQVIDCMAKSSKSSLDLLHIAIKDNSHQVVERLFNGAVHSMDTDERQRLVLSLLTDAAVAGRLKIAQYLVSKLTQSTDLAQVVALDRALQQAIQTRNLAMVLFLQAHGIKGDNVWTQKALYENGVFKVPHLLLVVHLDDHPSQLDQWIKLPSQYPPKKANARLIRWFGWLVERHGGQATVMGHCLVHLVAQSSTLNTTFRILFAAWRWLMEVDPKKDAQYALEAEMLVQVVRAGRKKVVAWLLRRMPTFEYVEAIKLGLNAAMASGDDRMRAILRRGLASAMRNTGHTTVVG
ncbi:Aste57867_19882 [Aphanomyces stellatus]|uniref:Aste57867_19882 protein n=1 Tax=Aphanomyces stellatus TaxID=120398 RepID=A0A485LEU8_9STRA|nr:hypothetical protein As57867_019816 [Aphanomyces stellatus]VFT96580.1 Aste57867_19882 [Aphanomyces stellatus]